MMKAQPVLMTTTDHLEPIVRSELISWSLSSTQLASGAAEVYLLVPIDDTQQRSKILKIEAAPWEMLKVR
jgi:hypothetical protein